MVLRSQSSFYSFHAFTPATKWNELPGPMKQIEMTK